MLHVLPAAAVRETATNVDQCAIRIGSHRIASRCGGSSPSSMTMLLLVSYDLAFYNSTNSMLFLFHVVVVIAVIAVVFGAQLKVVGIEFAYMQIEFEFGFANFIQDISRWLLA